MIKFKPLNSGTSTRDKAIKKRHQTRFKRLEPKICRLLLLVIRVIILLISLLYHSKSAQLLEVK